MNTMIHIAVAISNSVMNPGNHLYEEQSENYVQCDSCTALDVFIGISPFLSFMKNSSAALFD